MNWNPSPIVAALLGIITSAFVLRAAEHNHGQIANFDKRTNAASRTVAVVAEQNTAADALKQRIPGTRIAWDPLTSSPRFIFNENGFLSAPDSVDELRPKTLAETAAENANEPRDPNRRIKRFLDENTGLFGHSSEILAAARVSREYVTAHNGLRTVVWEQELDGIPVFEAVLYGHIAKNGELVSLSSQFLPALAAAADAGLPERQKVQEAPTISARQAVALAAVNIGETLNEAGVESVDTADGATKRQEHRAEVLNGDAATSLVWLPMNRQTMRLCWRVVLTGKTRGELFQVLVDAETGEPQVRHCWTSYANPVGYRIFPSDSPSPFSPGHPTPTNTQPSLTNRVLTNLVAISTNASPDGWIGAGRTNTIGNNVDAHLDLSGLNPDYASPTVTPPRPTGTTNNGVLTFDFALDLTNSAPSNTNNQKSAQVNAFYWCNWMHDRLYDLGFTEAAGNFQATNIFYSGGTTNNRGGKGRDAVLVDVQDGNGANVDLDPRDGTEARMVLGLWTGPEPDRDAAFDTEVFIHEYTHLLTQRRVGHGTGLDTQLQPGALGEGWGDFLAMCLLSESGDGFTNAFAYGAYSTYLWTRNSQTLTQNYHYGMRVYPYSTDLAKNPLTFNDLDGLDRADPPAVTPNPVISLDDPLDAYNAGALWAVTLWEVFANLVTKHGFTNGRETILRLVLDGMSLCPPNPTFLQARDALILADRVNSGGANLNEIWTGFARRGMGWSAPEPESDWYGVSVDPAFDVPNATNQLWYYATSNAVLSSAAIGMDGTIYFGSTDGKLYALTPGGTNKWEFAPSGTHSFNSSPAIGPDGTIYARRYDGYLYAVNPNGTQKWSYWVSNATYTSPAVALDGTVYVASQSNLLALTNGALKWTFSTGDSISSSPAIGPDGTIYFGGVDNKVHAVTPAGSTKGQYWPFVAGNDVASSPAIAPDGTVYVGSHDGKLYALYTDGTKKWEKATGGIIDSSPAIATDGTVYVGSQDYRVYGWLPDGTAVGPSAQTGHYIRSSPAVAADGTVYVGSYDGKLYAYNPNLTSKGTNWPFTTGTLIFSSPTLGSDGTVYFGSGNYKLYALRGLSGPAHSSWPMFRRDARHVANLGNITLHSAHLWSNNLVQFQVLANPALTSVEVQGSEDLANWSAATVVPLVNGSATCLDSPISPPRAKFYRAKNGAYLSMNPIGYMTNRIAPGSALIANQLNTTNNTVSGLMPNVPNGTLVRKWNETAQQYNTNTFSTSTGWSTNMTLLPGEGAWVDNVNASSNHIVLMFVGEVLQGYLVNPVPSGFSLRSSMVPQAGGVSAVLGYNAGDLDTLQGFSDGGWDQAQTYLTAYGWYEEEPEFEIGASFTIIPGAARTWARTFSVWP